MADAGRKMLAFHLKKLATYEPGVRSGDDRDAVHDMRVTTRRLRSMLKLFGAYYRKRTIKPYAKSLRQLARRLGAVRDLDVLQMKAEQYLADHSDIGPDSLNGLLNSWREQTADARKALVNLLDSRTYKRFVTDFAEFVSTSSDGVVPKFDEGEPILVRQIAPPVIYEHLAAVRGYETALDSASLDTLHHLRIQVKRLHYALEAFEEVMAPEAEGVLESVKTLQDYLGDLQDARIAGTKIQDYLDSADSDTPTDAILGYLSARADEKQRLLTGVSDAWAAFANPDNRRALALGISVL
jgi:CHAD domain-containing protein